MSRRTKPIRTEKLCRTCFAKKPMDEFYLGVGMADGRLNNCKPCVIKRVTERKKYIENGGFQS